MTGTIRATNLTYRDAVSWEVVVGYISQTFVDLSRVREKQAAWLSAHKVGAEKRPVNKRREQCKVADRICVQQAENKNDLPR